MANSANNQAKRYNYGNNSSGKGSEKGNTDKGTLSGTKSAPARRSVPPMSSI